MVNLMNKTSTINGIRKSAFQKSTREDQKQTSLYILTNKLGMEVSVTNFGGRVVTCHVPDGKNNLIDVVCGYSTIDEYVKDSTYFGAILGRTGNRIAKGRFTLSGKEYQLAINASPNNLHGGIKGFSFVVWDAQQLNDNTLKLFYTSNNGEENYPGKLDCVVTYQLEDGSNTLQIHYEAQTDQETIVNMSNHSYFNLSGAGNNDILDHIVTINADSYTPTDSSQIPTGQIAPVANTPFDFTKPQTVGSRINTAGNTQLQIGNGYDHNFVLNSSAVGTSALAARVVSPRTGISMAVSTTEPGVQFYTANSLDVTGKENKRYRNRTALCLETQHFPDSINQPNFPSIVLQPGKNYDTTTSYSFSVELSAATRSLSSSSAFSSCSSSSSSSYPSPLSSLSSLFAYPLARSCSSSSSSFLSSLTSAIPKILLLILIIVGVVLLDRKSVV